MRWMAVVMTGSGLASLQLAAHAQSVLAPPPEGYGGAATGIPASSTNQAYAPAIVAAPEPPPLPSILQWGPVDVRPHLLYEFVYGNGLQATPGQSSKTVINEVYPGVLFDFGKDWTLDYTPTLRYYSNKNFENTVDHAVSLLGTTHYNDWTFTLAQSYAKTTQPLVETGLQTGEQSYLTSVTATWEMNSALGLQLGFAQSLLNADTFQTLNEWTTPVWLDYRIEPRLSAGLGVTLGYDGLSASPDETFELGQARLQWNPGDKLSLQASGGVERRQLGGGAPDLTTPVFGATISYLAFPHTRLSANFSRSVSPSLFEDQVETTTSVGASLHQDITSKLSVTVDGSYYNRPYQNTALVPITEPYLNTLPNQPVGPVPTRLLEIDRVDNQWGIDIHVTWKITDHGTVDAFFSKSENTSGLSDFSYSSTQVGFSLGYRF